MRLTLFAALAFAMTASSAYAQDTDANDTGTGCSGEAVMLPLKVLKPSYLDLKKKGAHFGFQGSEAKICIGDDRITITANRTKTILCTDITDTGGKGMGHKFRDGDKAYDLWFVIDQKKNPLTLQFGLWADDAENAQYFWADTAAEICNI